MQELLLQERNYCVEGSLVCSKKVQVLIIATLASDDFFQSISVTMATSWHDLMPVPTAAVRTQIVLARSCLCRAQASACHQRFRVLGTGFRVLGMGFRGLGMGFRVLGLKVLMI